MKFSTLCTSPVSEAVPADQDVPVKESTDGDAILALHHLKLEPNRTSAYPPCHHQESHTQASRHHHNDSWVKGWITTFTRVQCFLRRMHHALERNPDSSIWRPTSSYLQSSSSSSDVSIKCISTIHWPTCVMDGSTSSNTIPAIPEATDTSHIRLDYFRSLLPFFPSTFRSFFSPAISFLVVCMKDVHHPVVLPSNQIGRPASRLPQLSLNFSNCSPRRYLPCLAVDPAHHRLPVSSDSTWIPSPFPGASIPMGPVPCFFFFFESTLVTFWRAKVS